MKRALEEGVFFGGGVYGNVVVSLGFFWQFENVSFISLGGIDQLWRFPVMNISFKTSWDDTFEQTI